MKMLGSKRFVIGQVILMRTLFAMRMFLDVIFSAVSVNTITELRFFYEGVHESVKKQLSRTLKSA